MKTFPDLIKLSSATLSLADAYLAHKVVTAKFRDDALHVAACSLAGISPLVSWNFKHLVNLRREDGFNAVNLLHGRPLLRIERSSALNIEHRTSNIEHRKLNVLPMRGLKIPPIDTPPLPPVKNLKNEEFYRSKQRKRRSFALLHPQLING